MRKRNALILSLVAAGFIAIAVASAMVTNVSAVDNPCDPVYSLIKACKANHGRWDTSCCCCVYH